MITDEQAARLVALQTAAERLVQTNGPQEQAARAAFVTESGLSPQGVELALEHCLEYDVSRAQLLQIAQRSEKTKQAHVLLSSNVFIGAFRAIAIGIAQAQRTFVRPSSRSRALTIYLHEASQGAFELASEIDAQAGDHVWVYGHDSTISRLRQTLPAGVRLHAHGSGMGLLAFVEPAGGLTPELCLELSARVATDVVLFDQRGCLSPRLLLVEGSLDSAQALASGIAAALASAEQQIPRGLLTYEELSEARRYVETFRYVGGLIEAGQGAVVLDEQPGRLVVPPVGRHLHVTRVDDVFTEVCDLGPKLTTIGTFGSDTLPGRLHQALGPRRIVDFGHLQMPAFDGPVDLRTGFRDELLTP